MDQVGGGGSKKASKISSLFNIKPNNSIKNKKTQSKSFGGEMGKKSLIQVQEGKG
jgi:hypothetical protein